MSEKKRQERYEWHRTGFFTDYNAVVGHYQVQSCLEHCRGNSLLDVACGDGMLTELFTPRFNRIVGVDPSGSHLARARERLPKVEFHESLIEDLKLEEKFSSVFMLDVLEHVADPVRAIQAAASFLSDDGVFIAHVPNANAINRRIAVSMGTLTRLEELSPFDIDIAGHRRYYTRETLADDVRRAGLKLVSSGGIFYKSLSSAQMDWFLKNGLWEEGGFGWGRVGGEKKDWKAEFCRACYEIGKEQPDDCNVVFVVASR